MKLPYDTDAGIGTRATLGVIVLETDETLEPEFSRMMARDGVALYHSRIPMVPEVRPETLVQMQADLPASARLFPSSLDFDVIGYGCTSASTVIGSAKVSEVVQTVLPKAKVTDPLAAIIAAGKALGVSRLGFVTPYLPEVSAQMRANLEKAGFAIAGFGSFEEMDDRVVARITEAAIADAAQQVAQAGDCDAIVISCTNLRCLQIIPEIEAQTGVPVISSNQALAWHMLRLAGVTEPQPQFGRLFTRGLAV
ncbi:aspartate/glutamate racemase family protein [Leisingera sp. HS039]|uniref:maleate cis-trans isomerase family protein n=1 Tax=unclassified Leisingera TaxID=2614906 RepID=UPI001070EF81|nr:MULTISPECIES: aspartate/glutamate racemase family protein [unclassified Leisingera]MBQ4825897.1 aspartate/glutamate racemase family protein [Leisingera sp. HS039]QBR34999.1 Asp/Glu racemase [Leisingera sp. NJS201]